MTFAKSMLTGEGYECDTSQWQYKLLHYDTVGSLATERTLNQ